ncbi:MAG: hypothetical protein ACO1NX_08795 [Chitinophagaceae bacterium]
MRKQSLFTVLTIAACSLSFLVAVYSFTSNCSTEICKAAEEQTEDLKPISGKMLWESLSSQFVSSVSY